MTNYIDILGMRLDIVQISDVVKIMKDWIAKKNYGRYIVISNANDVIAAKKDNKAKKAARESSLSVPDGISMVLLARMHGYNLKERVYGPDLMMDFFNRDHKRQYSHFFYGATTTALNLLKERLSLKFPGMKIAGTYSPPFRPLTEKEDTEVTGMINGVSPDILWVGLGCPKQQIWMREHRDSLRVPVMVGVGAAFDFLAGTKIQAPKWMQKSGLEWLFRLFTEPKRLWKRYILGYSLFLYLICKEFFSGRFSLKVKKGIRSHV